VTVDLSFKNFKQTYQKIDSFCYIWTKVHIYALFRQYCKQTWHLLSACGKICFQTHIWRRFGKHFLGFVKENAPGYEQIWCFIILKTLLWDNMAIWHSHIPTCTCTPWGHTTRPWNTRRSLRWATYAAKEKFRRHQLQPQRQRHMPLRHFQGAFQAVQQDRKNKRSSREQRQSLLWLCRGGSDCKTYV